MRGGRLKRELKDWGIGGFVLAAGPPAWCYTYSFSRINSSSAQGGFLIPSYSNARRIYGGILQKRK